MAFKFVAVLATLAVAVHGASLWNSQHQQQRVVQQGRSNGPWAVSQNWASWNEDVDRQREHQQQQQPRDDDRQQQWQRVQQQQNRWNDQRNRVINNNRWESMSHGNNDWEQEERPQWPQQQQQKWDRDSDEDFDHHPRYEFAYEVRDPRSGDFKAHQESRDGDLVRGQYSMLEADGTRRVVDYTSDSQRGFNANVRREGWARH